MEINVPETKFPRIVIAGGGFAGITLAKSLKGQDVQVVLIDENNYHTFQPLLYQVATSGLEPDSIAFPIRKIFKSQPNFFFRMARIINARIEEKVITTSIGDIHFDYLVIATGSDTNFFGNHNVETFSMPMKSIVESLNLRSLILQNFEQALLIADPAGRKAMMDIVVAGGGPTGVEMAGALAELRKHILPKDYPELDLSKMEIHLVEGGPKLLGSFSGESSEKTLNFLQELGVKVWLNTLVLDYDGDIVRLKSGHLNSKTLIWAAGVSGAPIDGLKADDLTRGKRYLVNEYSMIKGHRNIFAIGDVAAMVSNDLPAGHPMLAPVAIQQASHLGKNFSKILKGASVLEPFKYFDKGAMATVGRSKAVVDVGKFKTQGFLGWLMWMFVHLYMLIGFRNKVVVMVNWIWCYIIYDRGIRLIIRPFTRKSCELYRMKKAG